MTKVQLKKIILFAFAMAKNFSMESLPEKKHVLRERSMSEVIQSREQLVIKCTKSFSQINIIFKIQKNIEKEELELDILDKLMHFYKNNDEIKEFALDNSELLLQINGIDKAIEKQFFLLEFLEDKLAKEKLKKTQKGSMTRSMSEVIKLKQEQLEPNYKKNLYQKNEIIDDLEIKIIYWEGLFKKSKQRYLDAQPGIDKTNFFLNYKKIYTTLNNLKESKKNLDNFINTSLSDYSSDYLSDE
jgi:hypothetical protein